VTSVLPAGLKVEVDGAPAEVVRVPYASRSFGDEQQAAEEEADAGMAERAQQAK
jgi:hypothetical protein